MSTNGVSNANNTPKTAGTQTTAEGRDPVKSDEVTGRSTDQVGDSLNAIDQQNENLNKITEAQMWTNVLNKMREVLAAAR